MRFTVRKYVVRFETFNYVKKIADTTTTLTEQWTFSEPMCITIICNHSKSNGIVSGKYAAGVDGSDFFSLLFLSPSLFVCGTLDTLPSLTYSLSLSLVLILLSSTFITMKDRNFPHFDFPILVVCAFCYFIHLSRKAKPSLISALLFPRAAIRFNWMGRFFCGKEKKRMNTNLLRNRAVKYKQHNHRTSEFILKNLKPHRPNGKGDSVFDVTFFFLFLLLYRVFLHFDWCGPAIFFLISSENSSRKSQVHHSGGMKAYFCSIFVFLIRANL